MMALSSNKGCCQIFALFAQGLPNVVTINTSSAASVGAGSLHEAGSRIRGRSLQGAEGG